MRCGAILCAALLMLAGCGPRATPDPFVVGHIESRGSSDRLGGDQSRHAILLALEDHKEAIAGRKIQVLHVDAQGKPKQAHSESVRLITVNGAGALIADGDTASAMQMAEAASGHNVAVVTPASLPRLGGLNNVYSINVSAEQHGKTLARFAEDQFKAKKAVVLVDESDPLHLAIAEAIRNHWPSREPNAVTLLPLPEKEGELPKSLSTQQGDVYFFAASADRLGAFVGQWKSDSAQKPLVYAGRMEPAQKFVALESRTVYAAALYVPPKDWNDQQKAFAGKFRERFRIEPDETAFAAHDCYLVIYAGIDKAKVAGLKLREEIGKLETVATLAGQLSFDKQHARRPLHVIEISERQAKLVKTYDP